MINLKRIVEQTGMEGQYYDLGRDFFNFKRAVNGTMEQVKSKFDQVIGQKLVGKRVRARASRGYKQYVKDYEFDVAKVSIDDYYDNYVVVAYDNTTPKPKEYFLKPGFKITILGPATGQPSPQKGGKPQPGEQGITPKAEPLQHQNPDQAQHQPMMQAPAGNTPSDREMEESKNPVRESYDAYSMESIAEDIKPWLSKLLLKPNTPLREFIKGLGWMTNTGKGKTVAMYDLKIPESQLKYRLSPEILKEILGEMNRQGTVSIIYTLISATLEKPSREWQIRIKKEMTDTTGI